jgi:Zn-dependent peptidase ImmA (M78 family)
MSTGVYYRPPTVLLKELGVTEPKEIQIEAIAQYCGATVLYERLEGSAARILGFGDRAFITVDSRSRRERQRFSAAHELGHWMRDRQQMSSAFSCKEQIFASEWGTDNPERRANRYAAELLLPDFMFRAQAKSLPITFESVRTLAKLFETSLTATAIRMIELGSFPAMIVCSSVRGREWFIRGEDVPAALWPRDRPGAYTCAYDLLRGEPSEDIGPTDVQADGWMTHPESRQYTICEDSEALGNGYVLSLLWWKDERQLLDIESESD